MLVKEVIFEDFVNYRVPCMFIGTCRCDWKCHSDCPDAVCQNMDISRYPDVAVDDDRLIGEYLENPLTKAVVFGGLEPMLQFDEVYGFICKFRKRCQDDAVIYTGYYPEEIPGQIEKLRPAGNVVMKFGRYRSGGTPHFDEVLGVELSNAEQFGRRL